MGTDKTALVVSAHSADFVWRAGGAIALHAGMGFAVTVICLSNMPLGDAEGKAHKLMDTLHAAGRL